MFLTHEYLNDPNIEKQCDYYIQQKLAGNIDNTDDETDTNEESEDDTNETMFTRVEETNESYE